MYTNYNDIVAELNANHDLYLVNASGTKVTSKTVKDENDQYWRTNKDGKIVNCAPDKETYDDMRSTKNEDGTTKENTWNKDLF